MDIMARSDYSLSPDHAVLIEKVFGAYDRPVKVRVIEHGSNIWTGKGWDIFGAGYVTSLPLSQAKKLSRRGIVNIIE